MDDPNNKNLQAVIAPADVWHLAQGAAFKRAAELVLNAKNDDAAGSLNDFSTKVLEALSGLANGSFDTYLRSSDRPIAGDRRALSVQFDDARNVPMVEWPGSAASNSWGMVDIDGVGNEPGMVLASPFREMCVDRLPAGSRLVKLTDPHHAATAALVDVLQCAQRDADSAFLIPDSRAAWRRLNMIISIYRNGARAGLEVLGDDDFVNWKADMPMRFEISAAAGLICRIAATSRAQCSVAIHLMATWLQALADATEPMAMPDRQRMFVKRLKDASEGVEKALEGMNLALARAHSDGSENYTCMVIMRPVPQSIPVLAIVPAQPEEKVAPFRRRVKVT